MTIASPTLTRTEALARLTAAGQPYELATVEINGRARKAFKNAPTSLRALYESTASDLPFLVYADERLSFAQTLSEAAKIAQVLVHRYGVVKGDRVAISMRNYPEWVIAFTAITSIGAIAVAMNALWQPEEMAYGLTDSGAKVLFADQERVDRFAQCSTRPAVAVIAVRAKSSAGAPALAAVSDLPNWADWRGLIDQHGDATMPLVEIAPDDPAMIFYTSGSTGHPKGVLSSHRAVITALLSWELDQTTVPLTTGAVPPEPPHQAATLLAVPLFHVTGLNAAYLMSYRTQRKVVCMYKWDIAQAADLIEREQITSFVAPAAMTGDLVRFAQQTGRGLSSLLNIGGGGAPRAPEQVKQIEESFTQAMPMTGWGMTETNAIGTGIGGPDYLQRPASSGRCSALLELKVIGDNGQALPAGERGELLVRGTSMFAGYWNRPEVNQSVFIDDWFRTGDVAYIDQDGYLFIVDRIKDLIIRGGENIGCGQVEAALVKHPDVFEAAVYSVPDQRLGEEVGATVHGSATLNVEALREFLAKHLAKFEVPRYIVASPTPLPRTASGKILKRQLRDEAVAKLLG